MFNNKTRAFLLFTLILIATIGISAVTSADIDNNATDTPIIADTPAQESADSVQSTDVNTKNVQITKNTDKNIKGVPFDGCEEDSGTSAENTSVPVVSVDGNIMTLNDGNWTEYFDNDGKLKSNVLQGSELRFEGEFSDKFMIIDIPLNLTTAPTQGVLNNGGILVTADNVNITKLVMNSLDTEEAIITIEDSCNVKIEGNTLNMTTTEDSVETRAIVIDGGSDNVIKNNTITTIGPEDPIDYGADSSINVLYLTSIEAKSDRIIIDSNRITTKKNDVESEDLGTIFGIYVYGTSDNYLDTPQITNNEFVTEGKVYDYGVKLHYANSSLIENNTVNTTSEKYSSSIHVFVLNNSIINNNVVKSTATDMSYGIVLEGAMDLTSYDVLSTENTQVTNNVVDTQAKYVWAVEAYAGENNDISYNNVTVNADNGVAIALADQNSDVSYNNIEVHTTMESDISGSFDYIDPYTTGIKLSNNGLKNANDNIVEFNNVTVTTTNNNIYAVNVTTNGNSITDNDLFADDYTGDNAVVTTGTSNIVENNTPVIEIKNTIIVFDEISDAKYKGKVTISGSLMDEDQIGLVNQIVTLIIGETEVNLTTSDGIFEYTTSFKQLGEKTVTASFAGNEKYRASNATMTFNVDKQDTIITYDAIQDTKYKDTVTITGKVTDVTENALYNINALVYINGKLYKAKTDKTGTFTLTTTVNKVGLNNVTISYGGNNNYNSYETSTTFNVDKQDITITSDPIPDAVSGKDVTITGTVTDVTGKALNNINANIRINGKLFKAKTDSMGAFKLTTTATTLGTNNVTISYGGNSNYNSYETSTTFIVLAKAE